MARGDLILRGSPADGFLLIDAVTRTAVAGPLFTFSQVFRVAREYGAQALWREAVDDRGRPRNGLFKLPHLVQRMDMPG